MNKNELKKQYYVLGNAIGELGAKMYELTGKIDALAIKNNFGIEYKELLDKKDDVNKTLQTLIEEFRVLEEIIKNYE